MSKFVICWYIVLVDMWEYLLAKVQWIYLETVWLGQRDIWQQFVSLTYLTKHLIFQRLSKIFKLSGRVLCLQISGGESEEAGLLRRRSLSDWKTQLAVNVEPWFFHSYTNKSKQAGIISERQCGNLTFSNRSFLSIYPRVQFINPTSFFMICVTVDGHG